MSAAAPANSAQGRAPVALEDFESGRVDPADFDHAAHVYVAWRLLGEVPIVSAIERYTAALRRLTARLGMPGKYHETITWFFLFLIAERRQACSSGAWDEFVAANPDLLQDAGLLLAGYYTPDRLCSDAARASFLLPDRVPGQGAGITR
ncbi:MAG: hypothetical protein OEW35_10100 [Gammaproteobacteria bacterium]|nr:hypothetical protein [Gammaproteobacteria bacterium]MDH4256379.1 hypothetical protein [Gammaproteobacteria bacterium]MDH5310355.1 hypothetical protein [Gammaproteobacteria bacterium]